MITVRIFDQPEENDTTGLGDYDFQTVPRVGDNIRLVFKDHERSYIVEKVQHVFYDHSKPANVCLSVKEAGYAWRGPIPTVKSILPKGADGLD